MPLLGQAAPPEADSFYFKSLAELDAIKLSKFDGVLPYMNRSVHDGHSTGKGKLLVCHDYKGGYTEPPFALSYTFNFWSRCDIFIYFAHHRISTPPPGWVNAGHRQGVKMLGTIIFEGGGEPDCLRLLVGQLPTGRTRSAVDNHQPTALPVSPHYARLLADLADLHGFDGYLLNFECPLQGGFEQTRALTAWISLLRAELKAKVGGHAEVIWYDSVVITGQLAWQDRLNAYNLPFFLPSTGFFTNYTWKQDYPANTMSFFASLDPAILAGNTPNPKLLNDVYMGVDVWGRGSHGGGGLGSYRGIEHIAPESSGLSVALFGQAWSWETEQDKSGFTWEHWWSYERTLWVGSPGTEIKVPEAPKRKGEPDCTHGPLVPISDFFTRKAPPNPSILAFHTTFSPGVGRAWFVNGVKKFYSASGWTDIDKQCTIGDLVWPRCILAWEDSERTDAVPSAVPELCLDDAWNGGSSLRLVISTLPSDAEDASFRQVCAPLQSLAITPGVVYQMIAIYKIDADGGLELDASLDIKTIGRRGQQVIQVTPDDSSPLELLNGWIKLSAQFVLPAQPFQSNEDHIVSVGLTISIATEDPSQPSEFSILVGQMNIFPFTPEPTTHPRILWADYQPASSQSTSESSGVLSWEVAVSLRPQNVAIPDAEAPIPVWNFEPSYPWRPDFLYFNIYMQEIGDQASMPDSATWIGTSGLGGQKHLFHVEKANLPLTQTGTRSAVKFYVQGVTARGEILPWEDCVSVTVDI